MDLIDIEVRRKLRVARRKKKHGKRRNGLACWEKNPDLPVPNIFGTKLPVANISGN